MKSVKCYRFSVNQPADVNWWSALGESAAYLISSVFLGSEIVDVVDVVDQRQFLLNHVCTTAITFMKFFSFVSI